MNWRKWLARFGFAKLRIKAGFLDMEFAPKQADRAAAWDMYVELLTRVSTQALAADEGDERSALASIHSLFASTRKTLQTHGPQCETFAKLAIVILNQIIRPFTAKWHPSMDSLDDPERKLEFRRDLRELQVQIQHYCQALADLAEVEDWTELERAELSS